MLPLDANRESKTYTPADCRFAVARTVTAKKRKWFCTSFLSDRDICVSTEQCPCYTPQA